MPALEEDAKTLTEQDLATTESDFMVKEFPGSDMNAAHDSNSPTFRHSSYRRLAKNIQYGDVARTCLGYWGIVVVNTAIIITQLGFCVNYIIFTSNAFSAFFPVYNCTVTADCANHTVRVSPDCAESVTWRRWQDGDPDNGTNGDLTVSSNQSSSSDFEYSSGFDNVTGGVFASPSSTETASTCGQLLKEVWSSAPDLQLMVMAPTLVCILLVLVRNLRRLGLVSAVGNLALLAGALLVLGLLIASFQLSDSWVVSQVTGLPTFVSMTASALEGIGTVLPIEASMAENRHNFPVFLLAGLTIVVVVDVGVSVLGYLSFGSSTAQIITLNLQAASPPGVAVNAFLLVGVMLTFPLMAFPVVQLVEKTFFRNDKLCECEVKDPEQLSLLKDQEATNKACDQHHSKASPWKRSLLRVVLVLLVAGLAVVLRNNFAYVAAFTGAVGSITLAYTLPCIFHLQMCWSELSVPVKVKDVVIIVTGLSFTILSLFTTVQDLVTRN
ncbi:proton-coupled amino acid transporter 1-like [Pomacea canaliculata]|uniref:proton-coupled amino acid transporter 1-like n=1 Tax=Pomacea canaliculata TaxID=400727 RepID=UPI000D734835|nr:proton-coupled amino acid transporter 1-like [Pomacea canaliculata]